MKTNELLNAFGISDGTITATTTKITMKDRRTAVVNRLERLAAENPVTWELFNDVLSDAHWAVLPSKSLYTAAFGDKKGADLWTETEARWLVLQAIAAKYASELDAQTADVNSNRRDLLFAYIRDTLAYHGIKADKSNLSRAMLLDIGSAAIKFNFGDDTPEARSLGVTAFIKSVVWCVLGYNSKAEAVEGLSTKASRRASALRAKLGYDWDYAPYPAALTQHEKDVIDWDGQSARKELEERCQKALAAK